MADMQPYEAQRLADQLVRGEISPSQFAAALQAAPAPAAMVADLGVAQLDLDRQRRCGYPEVVYGEGKSAETLKSIIGALLSSGVEAFATRVDAVKAAALATDFPGAKYNPLARTLRVSPAAQADDKEPSSPIEADRGLVVIVTAGSSDLPVAEEARETALWMGCEVKLIQDVGVAGPHRLPRHLDTLRGADAVVVAAGMEGALPSVVGGYVACPVIAVPTSVGYGAALGGMAALLGMLNSCAANVAVVNIDAGFKAAYLASMMARNVAQARQGKRS